MQTTPEIYIKFGDHTLTVPFDPDATIKTLLDKTAEAFGIDNSDHIILSFGRKIFDVANSLKDYNVKPKSRIALILRDTLSSVTVKQHGKDPFTVEVTASNTIDDVKEKIQDKTGIPPEQQRIAIGKAVLDDGARTLESLSVLHAAVLTLSKVKAERATAAKGKRTTVSRRNAEANAEEEAVLQQTLVELSGRADMWM